MTGILDIIKALIEQIPWICATLIVYKVCDNKSKMTLIGIPDKFFIMSER